MLLCLTYQHIVYFCHFLSNSKLIKYENYQLSSWIYVIYVSRIQKSIWGWQETDWRQSCLRVCSSGPSEKQDMRFWLVEFVMSPPSGLLYAEASPFLNKMMQLRFRIGVYCGAFFYKFIWGEGRDDIHSGHLGICQSTQLNRGNGAFEFNEI